MEAGPSAGPGTQSEDGGGVGATGRNDGPLYAIRASLVVQMVKSACNAGDWGSVPGLGRSPGEGNGCPL